MNPDMCVPCGDGILNVRVGAIIVRDGKLLMVGNGRNDYLYSVGGRIKMGESAEEAIVREVFEETGVHMTVDRLAFVHENYFISDFAENEGKQVYEFALYFIMDVPLDFDPVSGSVTASGDRESLVWISPDTPRTIYPEFFRKDALDPPPGVTFYSTADRTDR